MLTLEDVANAGFEVVRHLGLEKLHTVVGCSMGGMSALAFCVRHPELADGLISISSATRALPFSIAVSSSVIGCGSRASSMDMEETPGCDERFVADCRSVGASGGPGAASIGHDSTSGYASFS